jgi:hypothetical protein
MNKTTIITIFLLFLFVIFSCSKKNEALRQDTVLQTTETEPTKNPTTPSQETNTTPGMSEFLQELQNLGYNSQEVRELIKIEKENYGPVLRDIMFNGGHFYYEGFDFGQTPNNCGIYAVRRKLKQMYDLDMLADKRAWYRLSDSQMRNLIATGPNADPEIDRRYVYGGESLACEDIVNLQIYMSIPLENCSLFKTDGFCFIHPSQIPDWLNPLSIVPVSDNIVAIDPTIVVP